jgi:beta-N-acetylhexosaminidase
MKSSEAFRERVTTAARRVIYSKLKYFKGENPVPMYPDQKKIDSLIPDPEGKKFFLSQACRSITLYKGQEFPHIAKENEKILLAGQKQFSEFFDEGKKRYPDAKFLQFNYSMGPNEKDWMSNYIEKLASGFDTVIICVADEASASIASRLKNKGIKTIIISVLSPIPGMKLSSWADIVLMSYSYSPYSFDAVFGALAGEFKIQGKFPLAEN